MSRAMRSRLLAAGLVVWAVGAWAAAGANHQGGAARWELVVLGIAQDGGIPHLRCNDGICAAVRAGNRNAEKVASVGVVDRRSGRAYLFDATPDFRDQVHALTGGSPPDGIFLTHAHIGHYTGLMYLGRESIGSREVPVHATSRMAGYLRQNGPWSLLVGNKNVVLRTIVPDQPVELPGGLRVTPFIVPHRDELSDTVGYRIQGPRATALYVPDTDRWETWPTSIKELANTADIALLDGTFASPAEVKGRDISEIPHPMMSVTRTLLRGVRARVWFIHVNHTNPEIDASDVVREGMTFEL